MSFKNKSQLIVDPHGDVFDASPVRAVRLTDTGVGIYGENNRWVHFIREQDPARARHSRDEVAKLILARAQGRTYTPNWQTDEATGA